MNQPGPGIPEPGENLVHQAAERIEQDLERDADPDRRHQNGEEHHGAEIPAGDDLRGEQYAQRQPEHDLGC